MATTRKDSKPAGSKPADPATETRRSSGRRPLWVDEVGSGITRMTAAGAKSGVPRLTKSGRADLAKAPIAPREAYLLSRIDGVATVEDLADLTGMPRADVEASLRRMERLGLVLVS
jgi:hypothetical protein